MVPVGRPASGASRMRGAVVLAPGSWVGVSEGASGGIFEPEEEGSVLTETVFGCSGPVLEHKEKDSRSKQVMNRGLHLTTLGICCNHLMGTHLIILTAFFFTNFYKDWLHIKMGARLYISWKNCHAEVKIKPED